MNHLFIGHRGSLVAVAIALVSASLPARAGVSLLDWALDAIELPLDGADESFVLGINDRGVVLGTLLEGGVEVPVVFTPDNCPPTCFPPSYTTYRIPPAANTVESPAAISDVLNVGFYLVGGARLPSPPGGPQTPYLRRHSLANPATSFEVFLPIPAGFDSGGVADTNQTGNVVGFVANSTSGEEQAVFWRRTTQFGFIYAAVLLDADQAVAISGDGPVLAERGSEVVVFVDPVTDPTDEVVLLSGAPFAPENISESDPGTGLGQARVVGSRDELGVTRPIVFPDPLGSPDIVFEIQAGDSTIVLNVDSGDILILTPSTPGGPGDAGFSVLGQDLSGVAGCVHDPLVYDLGFCPIENFASLNGHIFEELIDLGRRGEIAVNARNTTTGDQLAAVVYAIRPVMTLSPPSSTNFGQVEIGDTSTVVYTIGNAGGADLQISSIVLLEPVGDFDLTIPALPATVPPSGALTFDYHFAPLTAGFVFSNLRIDSNDPLKSFLTSSAIGEGVAPTVEPDIDAPPELDFGRVGEGLVVTASVQIANVGNAPLEVTAVSVQPDGPDFTILSGPAPPFSIPAGEHVEYVVEFDAFMAGTASATLVIDSDDPDEPSIGVTLTGVVAERPDPPAISMGDVSAANQTAVGLEVSGEVDTLVSITVSDGVNTVEIADQIFDGFEVIDLDLSGLDDGTLTVTVVLVDAEGDESDAGVVTVTKDTVAPSAPAVDMPTVNAQNVTGARFILLSEPFARLNVSVSSDIEFVLVDGTVPADGTFTIDLDVSTLPDGTLDIEGTISDAVGNTSPPGTAQTVKDTGVPGPPDVTLQSTINASDVGNVILQVTGEPGAGLDIRFTDGGFILGFSGLLDAGGSFSDTFNLDLLNDGNITVEVTQVDAAGNVSGLGTDTAVKDTVPPEVTLGPPVGQSLALGQSVSLEATVTDAGGVAAVTFEVCDAAQVCGPPLDGAEVEAGTFTTDVTLDASGAITVRVTAVDDAGNVTIETGVVTVLPGEPDITVSPASTNFSPPSVSTSSTATRPITIANDGTADLIVTSISVDTPHFRVERAPTLPVTIPPGEAIEIDAVFAPRTAGELFDRVRVMSNDPDEPDVFAELSGVAVAPDIDLAIDPGTFGDVFLGSIRTATVTITNNGDADLNVTDIDLETPGTGFVIADLPSLPLTLAPGASATFTAAFQPFERNSQVNNVIITSDDPDQPTSGVVLIGEGVGPDIAVDVFADLGELLRGQEARAGVEVTNNGNADLNIAAFGASSGQADVTVEGAVPAVIEPGASATYEVVVIPTIAGPLVVAVEIENDTFGTELFTTELVGTVLAPQPEIVVDREQIDFTPPVVRAGSTVTQPVTIANQGTADLVVTSVGVSSAHFRVEGVPTLPVTIPPGGSIGVDAVFAPRTAGDLGDSIQIESNDPGRPLVSVFLSGTAVAPDIGLSIDPATFGDVSLGSNRSATVTITNNGDADLNVSDIELETPGAGFGLADLPSLPLTLAPGASATFTAGFVPFERNSQVNNVIITSDDPDQPTSGVVLIGEGVGPDIDVDVFAELGALIRGQEARAGVEVTNTGNADLNIEAFGAASDQADVTVEGAVPALIEPGASAVYEVVVIPTLAGPLVVAIEIENDTFGSELFTFDLTGTVVEPQPSIGTTPVFVDFRQVRTGLNRSETITVSNSGDADLVVTGVDLRGETGPFALDGVPALPFTVAPGGVRTFDVGFAPSVLGSFDAELVLTSNDPDQPEHAVPLTGRGIAPDIAVSRDVIAFERVAVGGEGREILRISNQGNASLSISELALIDNEAGFTLGSVPTLPAVLVPGSRVDIDVVFAPGQSTDLKAATLVIRSDDPDEPEKRVAVTAKGSAPDIAVTPDGVTIEMSLGEVATRGFVITNRGDADLVVSSVAANIGDTHVSFEGAPPSFTLAPGGSQPVTATFVPNFTVAGQDVGEVVINSNDPDTPMFFVQVVVTVRSRTMNRGGGGGGGSGPCNTTGAPVDPALALVWLACLCRVTRRRRVR